MNKEETKVFEETTFENLNKEQKAAILKNDGPLRIIAGAGSGKTGVLTKKISYLIKKMGVLPERILALTFTNKAANEMKSRVVSIIGQDGNKSNISTFHALCYRFLRTEITNLDFPKNFIVIDSTDQIYILKKIYKEINLTSSLLSYASMIKFISMSKILSMDYDDEVEASKVDNDTEVLKIDIFRKYKLELESKKYVDFDDLLILTNKILLDFPEVRKV
jgi:DNA helicase-2/ATP-dependent DNA helicase PcrA